MKATTNLQKGKSVRRRHIQLITLFAFGALLMALGCTAGEDAGPGIVNKPHATPTASPSGGLHGGIEQASPTPSPTPTQTAPTPTPTPTESPSAAPTILRVMVSPTAYTLFVPAPGGTNASGYVSSVTLSATVLMSDTTTHGDVTWSSSDPAKATVDADGTVKARQEGLVTITATAAGSSVSESATVTILSQGRVRVIAQ